MQIRNNTLITECSAYDFKEMLGRKKVKSWLKSVSAFANTEASSFFTTFYNLNWGKNERIPVEEVVERVNSPLKKYPANEESSVAKFGVNAKMFGSRAVEKQIAKLRSMGILSREGADFGGYWRIVINPQTEK